jgi:hypothetical protein
MRDPFLTSHRLCDLQMDSRQRAGSLEKAHPRRRLALWMDSADALLRLDGWPNCLDVIHLESPQGDPRIEDSLDPSTPPRALKLAALRCAPIATVKAPGMASSERVLFP